MREMHKSVKGHVHAKKFLRKGFKMSFEIWHLKATTWNVSPRVLQGENQVGVHLVDHCLPLGFDVATSRMDLGHLLLNLCSSCGF